MVKLRKGKQVSQPSSTMGLMRFFDAETSGPKLTPEFVLVLTGIIAISMLLVHGFS